MNPVEPLRRAITAADGWQRRHPWAGVPYAVLKKFGNDNANLLVVALAWYGFTAIFPLLLVVVTLFGFIGEASIGTGLVRTLHEFPVVGSSFNPSSSHVLKGSTFGLIVGLLGLLYGAQGVTQTAQQAMATVWYIPQNQRTGFLPRLGRSLSALTTIGLAFLINAFVTGYATGGTANYAIRIPVLIGLLIINIGLYFATFTLLTAKVIGPRGLLPGAIAGGIIFTVLITLGTGLVTHQLKNASATYGAFGSIIGIVTFLLLLAKLSLYATELNPVLARRLYPRALPMVREPTEADRRVLTSLVHSQQRTSDEVIGVGFGDDAAGQAASDASSRAGDAKRAGDAAQAAGATPSAEAAPSSNGAQPANGARPANGAQPAGGAQPSGTAQAAGGTPVSATTPSPATQTAGTTSGLAAGNANATAPAGATRPAATGRPANDTQPHARRREAGWLTAFLSSARPVIARARPVIARLRRRPR